MASMGAPFYRMLLIVSMYGLGHIAEVRPSHTPSRVQPSSMLHVLSPCRWCAMRE